LSFFALEGLEDGAVAGAVDMEVLDKQELPILVYAGTGGTF